MSKSRDERLHELMARKERSPELTADELCRDCPELLEDLKRWLEQIEIVDVALFMEAVDDSETRDPSATLPAGTKRYRPLRLIGEGGFGKVFAADDLELSRGVVMKYMKHWRHADAHRLRRFFLEADVTARLQHPGVVPVFDKGRDLDGRPYYAMRRVENEETLAAKIAEMYERHPVGRDSDGWNRELRRLLESLVMVCETVAYAHEQGWIHRDIKPANVMIGPYGESLLMDWGLAKPTTQGAEEALEWCGDLRSGFADEGSTLPGAPKGSPSYMSPQQARGEWDRVGSASDIYSLGATLYALLTGTAPYQGDTDSVLREIVSGRLTPPRQRNSLVPRALEAVCLKAMSREPEDRYASAKDLADELRRWLDDVPVLAWHEPLSLRARRWLKRHRTFVTAAATTLLAALVLLGGFTIRLDQANTKLKTSNEEKAKALRRAEINLSLVNAQIFRLSQIIRSTNVLLAYQNDPLLSLVNNVLIESLDNIVNNVADERFKGLATGRRAVHRVLRHILHSSSHVTSTESIKEFAEARSRMDEHRKRFQQDADWVGSELAALDSMEALSLREEGKLADARTCLLKAFNWNEDHARAKTTEGQEVAQRAVGNAIALANLNDKDMNVDQREKEWCSVRDRALAMLDRFDQAHHGGDVTLSADDKMIFCIERASLYVFSARAYLRFAEEKASSDWISKAHSEALAAIESAKACPSERATNPELHRWTGMAKSVLGTLLMARKEYNQSLHMFRESAQDLGGGPADEWTMAEYRQSSRWLVEAGISFLLPILTQSRAEWPGQPEELKHLTDLSLSYCGWLLEHPTPLESQEYRRQLIDWKDKLQQVQSELQDAKGQ